MVWFYSFVLGSFLIFICIFIYLCVCILQCIAHVHTTHFGGSIFMKFFWWKKFFLLNLNWIDFTWLMDGLKVQGNFKKEKIYKQNIGCRLEPIWSSFLWTQNVVLDVHYAHLFHIRMSKSRIQKLYFPKAAISLSRAMDAQ